MSAAVFRFTSSAPGPAGALSGFHHRSRPTAPTVATPATLAVAFALLAPTAAHADDPRLKLEPFLAQHCYECHDDRLSRGGLDLTSLATEFLDPDVMNRWVLVHDRIERGEMPPPQRDRPDPDQIKAFTHLLGTDLAAADRQREARDGLARVRRLNRTEYEQTLQDLLSLPLLRVRELLPEDGQQHGFDKLPGALEISHIQMRNYLGAADAALTQARVPLAEAPETTVWRQPAGHQHSGRAAISIHAAAPLDGHRLAPGLSTRIVGNPVENFGNTYRAADYEGDPGSVAILSGRFGAHQPRGLQPDRFQVPVGGWYRFRFSAWGLRWDRGQAGPAVRSAIRVYRVFDEPWFRDDDGRWQGTPLDQETVSRDSQENTDFYGDREAVHVIRVSLEGQVLGFFDAPSMKPTEHELTVWLEPGETLSLHFPSLPANGPANWPASDGVFAYEGPAVAVDWFEIEGPLVEQWPPASHRRLFGPPSAEADANANASTNGQGDHAPADRATQLESAAALLHNFATAAFRRPTTAVEVAPYVDLVDSLLDQDQPFAEALTAGYQALLCSPDFLFLNLHEAQHPDHALAARLSYFLWGSMPDAELLDLAARGVLNQPDVLLEQTGRLLADPRSERFVEHFLDHWLQLREIDFTTPDPQLYPEFDPWLRDSMLAETRAYFRRLIDENRGVDHLVASDFVVINQRLAELYGIRGVDGAELRPVPVPDNVARGGLLTQASVLKVTADGTSTSPILRGIWVTERILGIHVPDPPPDIPIVEPDASGATTIRELIEMHRAAPACAGCHAIMDPPGLALERFDVIGGWRDLYRASGRPSMVGRGDERQLEPHVEILTHRGATARVRLAGEIDPTGVLADGRNFDDIDELLRLLAAEQRPLARNLARQLAIYATGTGHRFADRAAIEAIVDATEPEHFGIRSLIEQLVLSPLFQPAIQH